MPDELLSPDQIAHARTDLPDWQVDDTRLRREIVAPSFLAGIDLVRRVAQDAERRDHHPDMDIRWRTVTFVLSTHSAGGLTQRDLELAADIDRAAAEREVN